MNKQQFIKNYGSLFYLFLQSSDTSYIGISPKKLQPKLKKIILELVK